MKDFHDLVVELERKNVTSRPLIQTMVELTYGCNLRCVHCYNPTHDAKGELSTEEVQTILDQLARENCLWLGFTGGELFTRRDSLLLMRHARSLGMIVSVVTNATLVTRSIAEQLRELGPYQVDVSLYGATAETYEAVTQVRGSYSRFIQGLAELQQQSLPIFIKLVMMTLNVHELNAMRDFAQSRKLPYEVFSEIHPRVTGSREPLTYRLPSQDHVEIWKQSVSEASEPGSCGGTGGLFECLCGKSNAAVTPYGEMNLCLTMQTPKYDLRRGQVADGWRHLQQLVASAQTGPEYACSTCHLAPDCTRGTMDGWLEQGRFDGPCIEHFRETAEQKVNFKNRRTLHGTDKST